MADQRFAWPFARACEDRKMALGAGRSQKPFGSVSTTNCHHMLFRIRRGGATNLYHTNFGKSFCWTRRQSYRSFTGSTLNTKASKCENALGPAVHRSSDPIDDSKHRCPGVRQAASAFADSYVADWYRGVWTARRTVLADRFSISCKRIKRHRRVRHYYSIVAHGQFKV